MKHILLFCFGLLTILSGCMPVDKFEISGKLSNAEGKKIYLTQRANYIKDESNILMIDSCIIYHGSFHFKGHLDEPNYYSILIEHNNWWKPFILDNLKITIVGDGDSIQNAKIIGSRDQELKDSLSQQLSPLYTEQNLAYDNYFDALKRNDTIHAKLYKNQNLLMTKSLISFGIIFIKKHPDCFESLNQLEMIYRRNDKEESKKLFNGLSERLKNHSVGKQIQHELFEVDNLLTEPLSFSQADTSGKVISIDKFRNNYLLVDFWSSWCGPCRAENPNLIKAYEKYKSKGFEIIGVSLDSKKRDWLSAIKKDNVNWVQVSDLKGWKNEVSVKYGIYTIPANFLLDKEGKIIAKNLKGEQLLKKISELYQE